MLRELQLKWQKSSKFIYDGDADDKDNDCDGGDDYCDGGHDYCDDE